MSKPARRVNLGAQSVGIVIGCILGMCPLLWLDHEKKALKDAFEDADGNGDGHLTGDEIDQALHRYGLMMSQDEVLWLLARCDKDHNGMLEVEEFTELVRHWKAHNYEYHEARENLALEP